MIKLWNTARTEKNFTKQIPKIQSFQRKKKKKKLMPVGCKILPQPQQSSGLRPNKWSIPYCMQQLDRVDDRNINQPSFCWREGAKRTGLAQFVKINYHYEERMLVLVPCMLVFFCFFFKRITLASSADSRMVFREYCQEGAVPYQDSLTSGARHRTHCCT